MVSLTYERSYMQKQLLAHAKRAALLRTAADGIEEQNIEPWEVAWLREQADAADEQVDRLEHNIADATARLAIMSRGLPDPGVNPAPF